MALKDDMDRVMAALEDGRAHEDALCAALGGTREHLLEVLAKLQEQVRVKRVKIPSIAGFFWVDCGSIIARCPWGPDQVLQALQDGQRFTSRELEAMAGSAKEPMSLLLRRMEFEKQIKQMGVNGLRKWIPFSRHVANGGERKPVRNDTLLRMISKHQPVRLEKLMELTGRGRIYLRERVHKLRRKGKVCILGLDGSWLYTLPGYQRSAQDVEREILLRCEDAGGDCLKWSGAHNKQGHALVRHDGNVRRVDIVLWTAVHGKAIKPGHTLVRTCETPGCCNHDHHKQVTRSAAMKKAFAEIGFGGEVHGRRVSQAVRHKIGSLTPDEVELIRTSPLNGAKLARQMGKTKSVVNGVRSGKCYRDYSQPANPFAGLKRAAA